MKHYHKSVLSLMWNMQLTDILARQHNELLQANQYSNSLSPPICGPNPP